MKDENKKKEELINELVKLRKRIAALEGSEIERNRAKQSVIKPKGMANTLYVIDGPDKGKLFTVSDGITTIGRSPDNDIRISDRTVSRHHARLLVKGDRIVIVDLNSLRGVLIDGEKAEPERKTEISKESSVTIGNTTLSFQEGLSRKITSQAHLAAPDRRPFDSSKSFIGSQRDYTHNLELLLRASNILSQSLDIGELLSEVVDQIFALLKRIDRGAILLLDRETGELHEAVSKTRTEDKEGIFSKINYSRTIVKRTIQDGEPVTISDSSLLDKADLSDSMKQMNVMSVMCVPLKYKGDVRGVIYVDSIGLPEGFRKDDLQLLTGLGNTAAIAIENAQLYEKLKQELDERRHSEEALRKSEQEKAAILDSMVELVAYQDTAHKVLWTNRTAGETVGLMPEQLVGRHCYEIWQQRSEPCVDCPVQKTHETGQPQEGEITSSDGRSWFMRSCPVMDENGNIMGVVETTLETTERRAAEEALRRSEAQKKAILDASIDRIRLSDTDMRIIWANETHARELNIAPEDIIGQYCHKVFVGKNSPCDKCPAQKALKTGKIEHSVLVRPQPEIEGGDKYLDSYAVPIKDEAGDIVHILAITRDITAAKKAEEQTKQSLKEKELLLQEIYHRVKNNMQVISSLLKLQAETIKDERLRALFRDSEHRVRAMSLVHEKLYQAKDLAHVPFKDYLTSLIRYLYQSYTPKAGTIELVTEIEEIPLDITLAIPCGLITNELLSNALKHAFPGERTGTITLSLRSPEPHTYELTVSDDGIGLPEAIDLHTTTSLGLHLVTILVEDQLKGEIEVERTGGTRFRITFKVR